jgi:uncharacterized protein (UPF0262 family)
MYRLKVLETWEGGILFGLLKDSLEGRYFSEDEVKDTIFEHLVYLLYDYVEEKDEPVSVHLSLSKKKIVFEVEYEAFLTSVYKESISDVVVWEEV